MFSVASQRLPINTSFWLRQRTLKKKPPGHELVAKVLLISGGTTNFYIGVAGAANLTAIETLKARGQGSKHHVDAKAGCPETIYYRDDTSHKSRSLRT